MTITGKEARVIAVKTLFWAELRHRWRSWTLVTLLVMLISGTVMAGIAAGQRTASAYPRFVQSYGFDALAFALHPVPAINTLPDVSSSVVMRSPTSGSPTCDCSRPINPTFFGIAEIRPSQLHRFVKLVSGRMPDLRSTTEVLASFPMAQDVGVHVGTVIRVPLAPRSAEPATVNGSVVRRGGPTVMLRVVGIEAADIEFQSSSYPYFDVYVTPAFDRKYNPVGNQIAAYFVRLKGGIGDLPRFQTEARKLGALSTTDLDTTEASNESAIHPQAIGWWILAGVAGLLGLFIIAQALARQATVESDDFATLGALGMSRRQLFVFGVLRTGAIAGAGAIGGVALAYLLSSFAPVGEARTAEPSGGLAFDTPALLLGALATVLVVVAVGLRPVHGSLRTRPIAGHSSLPPSRAVGLLRRSGAPPSVLIGVSRAIGRGRGQNATPIGPAILSMVLAVTTLTATTVFGASLAHLTDTPALYGQPFDAIFTANGSPNDTGPSKVLTSLLGNSHISRITAGIGGDVTINGRTVDALASHSLRGTPLLTAINGRLPSADNEVTLGVTTMRLVHAHVGSTVRVAAPSPDGGTRLSIYHVVGTAAFPPDFGAGGLGTGATFSISGLLAAQCAPGPGRPTCEKRAAGDPNENYLVRASRNDAGRTALSHLATKYASDVQFPMPPDNLVNFGQAVNFPLILSMIVILFGLATLIHVLVVSTVRRGKETGILVALGFRRRQTALTVFWQTTTIAIIAALLGVPLGAALGRLIWRLFAGNLGVAPVPVAPIPVIVGIFIGTLVVGLLVAAVPAYVSSHRSGGALLRESE
jgi:FtsX-like permease family